MVSVLVLLLFILSIRAPLITHFAFVPDVLSQAPDEPLYGAENVWFNTSDGYRLHGLFFSSSSASNDVVLYLHGNAGHLFNRVETAKELSQQGINVFLIDYRGYGLSEGLISEAGFYDDAQSALNWLLVDKGFNVSDVSVLGRSIGSVAAMKLAVDNAVNSVVLVSPIANASAMARAMNMSFISPFAFGALDNLDRAKRLQRPLLIVHGDADVMVPIDQGRDVYAAATLLQSSKKQFVSVKDADHHNVRKTLGDKYWPLILSFISHAKES